MTREEERRVTRQLQRELKEEEEERQRVEMEERARENRRKQAVRAKQKKKQRMEEEKCDRVRRGLPPKPAPPGQITLTSFFTSDPRPEQRGPSRQCSSQHTPQCESVTSAVPREAIDREHQPSHKESQGKVIVIEDSESEGDHGPNLSDGCPKPISVKVDSSGQLGHQSHLSRSPSGERLWVEGFEGLESDPTLPTAGELICEIPHDPKPQSPIHIPSSFEFPSASQLERDLRAEDKGSTT